MADFETPELQEYTVVPKLEEGTMAHSSPFVSKAKFQEPLGFPSELVDNWEEAVLTKMDDLRTRYRGFQVFLDSCVKCGACTDK